MNLSTYVPTYLSSYLSIYQLCLTTGGNILTQSARHEHFKHLRLCEPVEEKANAARMNGLDELLPLQIEHSSTSYRCMTGHIKM